MGVIGTGVRGSLHLRNLAARKDAQVVEACDVYQPHLDNVCPQAKGEPVKIRDYRAVLDR